LLPFSFFFFFPFFPPLSFPFPSLLFFYISTWHLFFFLPLNFPFSYRLLIGLPNLGNVQMSKILGMLQQIHFLCANGRSAIPIPTAEELFEREKQKLEGIYTHTRREREKSVANKLTCLTEEKKRLEAQLVLERQSKEKALEVLSSDDSGIQFVKQIEEERKKLAQERQNVEKAPPPPTSSFIFNLILFLKNKDTIENLNKRLKELVMLHSDTLRTLEEERGKLVAVEETIKELRQHLMPLHIKAKAMQIPSDDEPTPEAPGVLVPSQGAPAPSTYEPPSVLEIGTRTR
jgi:hypothetical protein